jgi:hypothetical protein
MYQVQDSKMNNIFTIRLRLLFLNNNFENHHKMKFRVFWDVAPCSHTKVDLFRDVYCLHHQGDESFITLMMEAVCTSETSVNST